LVEHGVTGYVIDVEHAESLRDAVMALAADENLKLKMGASGFQRCCERFGAVETAATMMDLYQRYC
jgi:glycosyltransferase involved in cell wall biosynthesis